MRCPRCQHENETGAKFCEECAAPLARACANCGRRLSPTAKFCPECAHPAGQSTPPPLAQRFDSPESYTPKHLAEKILTSKSSVEGERKLVTVLFADVATAEAHYGAAVALGSELGMRPLVAHCRLGLGKLHRRTGDHSKANEHLAAAAAMYREMDMNSWLGKAEAEPGP